MVFYFELVELSMNLEHIMDKVDKEDNLVENWTQGSVGPEMMQIVGSKIYVNTQIKILALNIKNL